MRTNIEIDDKLMKKAMKASGASTKRAVVEEGLALLVKSHEQQGIRKLRGKIEFWDDVIEDRVANSVYQPLTSKPLASKQAA
jgi:Arc/MetJ family transcription regulator